jgi:peptide-methionine (S)-S-oxide reductase
MLRLVSALLFIVMTTTAQAESRTAVFAGGCFWCMEAVYQDLEGVTDVVSGFTGGDLENPTYKGRHDGHYEAIQVSYDPAVISYQQLLNNYWRNVDPFDSRGQFCDKGESYRAAIFVDEEQRQAAESSMNAVIERFEKESVATEILPAARFWPVEDYHQDYYLKNPVRYKYYKWNCGRQQRLDEIWGKS